MLLAHQFDQKSPRLCALEQISESPRLGAQVLIGGLDGGPQFGRGVPWPTWIVENGPRQRDQVRISSRNDRFRLLEAKDETYCDDGYADRGLHRAGGEAPGSLDLRGYSGPGRFHRLKRGWRHIRGSSMLGQRRL